MINRVDMWKEGKKVLFECTVEETGKACLTGGWAEVESMDFQPKTAKSIQEINLKSKPVFAELSNRLRDRPEIVSKVGAIFRWIITKDKKPVAQWRKFYQK